MRLQALILISSLSLFFVGCNDDIARNRGKSSNNNNGGTGQTITKEIFAVYSGINRNRRSVPISYTTEVNINSESANIRRIPDINLDDDGADGVNVSTRSTLGRPTIVCGLGKTTLKEKIADCASASKNGLKATWEGTLEAGNAESTWKLVTLAENTTTTPVTKYEVWIDERTGMVWSDVISTNANWCKASGSDAAPSATVAIDCATLDPNNTNICTSLDLIDLPGVTWRLPTRQDFLQADIDGMRFVLKPGTNAFWTATVSTVNTVRDSAWTYLQDRGTLSSELMNTDRNVRCIGTPNF